MVPLSKEHIDDLLLAGEAYNELLERLHETERMLWDYQRTVALLIKLNGGKIEVPTKVIVGLSRDFTLVKSEDIVSDCVVYSLIES